MSRRLIILFLLSIPYARAQQLSEFNAQRTKTDQNLMLGLGSWATANFVVSGIGWATTSPEGEAQYFHQMNVMWNAVNIGLAIPGYIKAKKASTALSLGETIKSQYETEKIFLFNTGLDIGYMASGLLLRSEAKSDLSKEAMYRGYGNSLLLQGGFLFVFDLTACIIHSRHRTKKLNPLLDGISLSSSASGVGLKWKL